jgi:hypothetical protein
MCPRTLDSEKVSRQSYYSDTYTSLLLVAILAFSKRGESRANVIHLCNVNNPSLASHMLFVSNFFVTWYM